MSENAITLVELDVTPEMAEDRAATVAKWLVDEGIIVPNPARDDLWQPSEFMPGPNVVTVAPDAHQFLPDPVDGARLGNSGVDVTTAREMHHPTENYEPPPCPNCGTPLDEEVHYGLVEAWLEGPEPTVNCATCGQSNLIGDWVSTWTFYVGNLAVRFNNWSPLTDEFVADLGSRMGTRYRMVLEHS